MPAHGGGKGGWYVLACLAVTFIALPAGSAASDVIIYTDPALEHALRDVAGCFTAQTGAPAHRFAAPPLIIVTQLRPTMWNDIVTTLTP